MITDQFVEKLRAELRDEINKQTGALITQTNERKAGYIQGMIAAFEMVNLLYTQHNDDKAR